MAGLNRSNSSTQIPLPPKQKNEGEGSPSSARSYREGVEKYVKSHDVDQAADDAAMDLDDEDDTDKFPGARSKSGPTKFEKKAPEKKLPEKKIPEQDADEKKAEKKAPEKNNESCTDSCSSD